MSVYAPLLRNRKYVLLITGQVTSQVGSFIGYIVVMAILYKFTGSSLLVGTYMAAQAITGLLVGPLAGAAVDRWDRRKLMIFSDLARAGLVLMLMFATAAWQVILIAMFKSVASTVFNPAETALTPRIAGKDLPAALSMEQTLQGTVQILGPVLGGVVVGFIGLQGAFAIDAMTFLISSLSLSLFRLEPDAEHGDGADQVEANKPNEGRLAWLNSYRTIFADTVFTKLAIMRGLALVGVWAINVVLVAFAYETLRVGSFGYGLLSAAMGAGGILGSLSSGLVARHGHPFGRMAVAAVFVALCIAGTGLAPSAWVAYALFFGAGLGIGLYNVTFSLLLQTSVSNEYLGRAAAGMQIIDQVIILLSLGAGGFLADMFGVRPVMVVGGVLIGLTGWVALTAKRATGQVCEIPPVQPTVAEPASAAGLSVKRMNVMVHDQSARAARASGAAAVDEGENSIIIGYDGRG